jgi:hypothetical protein
MASGGKRKTTMAKLNRERKLHERRAEKQARKDARKHGSTDQGESGDLPSGGGDQPVGSGTDQNSLDPVVHPLGEL